MTPKIARRSGAIVAAALLAGALIVSPVTPATAAPIPCAFRAMETVTLKTLHVEVEIDKKSYRVGDSAKMTITVTRPDDEDPLGQGVPIERPVTQPAEGINAGVGLTVGNVFLYGFGAPTDANGKTEVNVLLRPYTPASKPVTVSVYAWKKQAEVPCFTLEESGTLRIDNAFKVTK